MKAPEEIIASLKNKGELWEVRPGLVGMKGDTWDLFQKIDFKIRSHCLESTSNEWSSPQGIAFETLERADYFASFPQWLTAAAHLSDDPSVLESVAQASDKTKAAKESILPPEAAMPPAVCYHTYANLKGQTLPETCLMTAQGTCWRHEGDRFRPLERGWAFTMREIVCIGSEKAIVSFKEKEMNRAKELADTLGIPVSIADATDPFFSATAKDKKFLQKLKALKQELTFPLRSDQPLAIFSANNHETRFGEWFDIRLSDETPAYSACVGFGLERWLLAFLVTHGPDQGSWPRVF